MAKKLRDSEIRRRQRLKERQWEGTSLAPKIGAAEARKPAAGSLGAELLRDTSATHFKEGKWSPERQKLHEEYARKVVAGLPKSKGKPTIHMTGGGPASGKTTGILENPRAGIPDKDAAAYIDPDSAKMAIPEYVEAVSRGDKGAAAAVHEESSHMAKLAMVHAIKEGHDIVYDSIGDSGIDKLSAKVKEWRDAGAGQVVVNYATVPIEEAIRRAKERGDATGRYIPEDLIRAAYEDVAKTSLAGVERGVFDECKVWDTQGSPDLIASAKQKVLTIHKPEKFEAFKKQGQPKPVGGAAKVEKLRAFAGRSAPEPSREQAKKIAKEGGIKSLETGPRGGIFYVTQSGKKFYVGKRG